MSEIHVDRKNKNGDRTGFYAKDIDEALIKGGWGIHNRVAEIMYSADIADEFEKHRDGNGADDCYWLAIGKMVNGDVACFDEQLEGIDGVSIFRADDKEGIEKWKGECLTAWINTSFNRGSWHHIDRCIV